MRHYATSRKGVGFIPNEVIGYLNWRISSSCTIGLGSTQRLIEMSTKDIPGRGKRAVCLAVQTPNISFIKTGFTNQGRATAEKRENFHISCNLRTSYFPAAPWIAPIIRYWETSKHPGRKNRFFSLQGSIFKVKRLWESTRNLFFVVQSLV
jgi:hypothetical protein